ncbi:MAG: DNA primase noncatalytic subunit PriX [Acidilobus sp.]
MAPEFEKALTKCTDDISCEQAAKSLLEAMCPQLVMCSSPPQRRGGQNAYEWVEKVLANGVPDGRHRLILYVIARYLVNVKDLDERDAISEISDFIQRSCKNYGNCSKVYESWIRNVVSKVKTGGWKPWTLEKLKERDPQLYSMINDVLGKPA